MIKNQPDYTLIWKMVRSLLFEISSDCPKAVNFNQTHRAGNAL